MKLRIHGNSLRLRLNRPEIDQLRKTGSCAQSLRFGSGAYLTYIFATSSQFPSMDAQYQKDCIRILLPLDLAREWAGSDQVSLSLNRTDGSGTSLLIEKDFRCLHRDEANPTTMRIPFRIPHRNERKARLQRATRAVLKGHAGCKPITHPGHPVGDRTETWGRRRFLSKLWGVSVQRWSTFGAT